MQNNYKLLILMYFFVKSALNAQDLGNYRGDFESNSHLYEDDEKTGAIIDDTKGKFRSNNYFRIGYTYAKFSFEVQYEAYLPNDPLVGYSPQLNDNKIATYTATYTTDKLQITAGYFYDQFGNGFVLRLWEDRQLGLNNALRGIRVKHQPTDYMSITGLFGKQRVGFETSKGSIHGFNMELDLDNLFHLNATELSFGTSYVGRYENEFGKTFGGPGENLVPPHVDTYSFRLQMNKGKIASAIEYAMKGEDARLRKPLGKTLNGKTFKGGVLQLDLAYVQKGLGLSGQFRRVENFGFYSDRKATGNVYNDQVINFIPSLTKQHDYSLANIYVYATQSQLIMFESELKSGEIGMQFDLFYKFKKRTGLGGKYGTKIAFNFSQWHALKAKFNTSSSNPAYFDYSAEFLQFGNRLFSDASLEVRKKFTSKFNGIFTYVITSMDPALIKGGAYGKTLHIDAHILALEGTKKIGKGRSIRMEWQHLWTKQDLKNWSAVTFEYVASSRLSFFVSDMYNYGNLNRNKKTHYYNIGGSYTKGAVRVALSYGRQRNGLLCIGGICRVVPAYTGLTLNLNATF